MKRLLPLLLILIVSVFLNISAVDAGCTGGTTGPCYTTAGGCNIGQRCTDEGNGCGCYDTSCSGCSGSPGTCPGGGLEICNYTTCSWGCNTSGGSCTSWSGWSPCIGGYQQRECQDPPGVNDTQQRTCTVNPTSTPGGGDPPTNTPPPPTPTAFIRARAFNPQLTPVVVASQLCKSNCSVAPCAFVSCQSNVNYVDVAGAGAQRGGALRDSSIVVLGVTPVTNGSVDNSGTYSANCRGAGAGNYCYYWPTAINTGSRVVRYIVATPTPTNTPTPTPGPWVKLKDSSYVSRTGIINRIPLAPIAYDSSDTVQPFLIVGEAGVCAAPTINLTSVNTNAKTGDPEYRAIYTPAPYSMTAASFTNYVKSRKEYKTITSMNEITANGLYVFSGNINLSSVPSQFDQYNVVLLTSGTITVNTASFVPTKAVVLVATTINFDPAVTAARGVFIADSVSIGTTSNQGLKITGNLIAQSGLVNNRMWANPNRPSFFISFDPSIYIDALPYLSTANYEWKQLQ